MKKIFCLAIAVLSALTAAFGQTVSEPAAETLMQVTTRLPGHATPSTITVAVQNGLAIYQDDIILGPIEELLNPAAQDRGLVIEDLDDRWPNGVIPFEIDEDFSAAYKEVILTAIEYINGSTNLLLVPRGANHSYWLEFEPADVCQSSIGLQQMWGQSIKFHDYTTDPEGKGCGFSQIIHEIAHAAGIWHEQCRADRDDFVNIHWDNIVEEKKHNYLKNIDDNIEIGPYDFISQMHYESRQFAINKNLPTMTRKNGSEEMGNSFEYSPGDVAAINWLYPVKNCSVLYTFFRPNEVVERPLFYQATLSISSNVMVNASNLTYDAGYSITLSPGFEVREGKVFRAVIDGCGGQVLPLIGADADEWYAQTGTYEERLSNNLGVEKPILKVSAEGLLQSIAPNPFSGSTTVTYVLEAEQQVAMSLMDATGKLVATPLPAQTQSEGEHQFNLEAGSLPAGMYFLVLQMGEKRETKRLILSK